jgi:hypothetical protein
LPTCEKTRKENGPKKRDETKILLAKVWRKVRRQSTAEQSDDFAHKITYGLSREY